jgi:cysteine desulfurase
VRPDLRPQLRPLLTGGGQEGGLRPGTLNVAGIVGLAAALGEAVATLDAQPVRWARRAGDLWRELRHALGEHLVRNSPEAGSLPGTLNFTVMGLDGRTAVTSLSQRGWALSAGSACSAKGTTSSHVLVAAFGDGARARGALRVGFGVATESFDPAEFAADLKAVLADQGG